MKRPFLLVLLVVLFVCVGPTVFCADSPDEIVYSEDGEPAGFMKIENGKIVFLSKDDVKLKKINSNEWEIHNREEKFLGTLERDDRTFRLYDINKTVLGIILSGNEFRPRGARKVTVLSPKSTDKKIKNAKITPQTAKLYLQVLPYIKKMK